MPDHTSARDSGRPPVIVLSDPMHSCHGGISTCLESEFTPIFIDQLHQDRLEDQPAPCHLYLVDSSYHGGAGIPAARLIRKHDVEARIIMLADLASLAEVRASKDIDHFLLKPFENSDLLRAVRHFSKAHTPISEEVPPKLPSNPTPQNQIQPANPHELPSKDRESPHPPPPSSEPPQPNDWDDLDAPPPFSHQITTRSMVEGRTPGGSPFQGDILRIDNYTAVCQITHPDLTLLPGQELSGVSLSLGGTQAYFGKVKVISSLREERGIVSEFGLGASSWLIGNDSSAKGNEAKTTNPEINLERLSTRMVENMGISREFKLVAADFADLLRILEQTLAPTELQLQSLPAEERKSRGETLVRELLKQVGPEISKLVSRFERVAQDVPEERETIYMDYMRGIVHPFILSSPLIHRSYSKPLGVPGDYGILAMLMDDPFQGRTLFDKLLNAWLIQTPAGDAYRHRMGLMVDSLVERSTTAHGVGKVAEILSLGCGAAREVQEFFKNESIAFNSSFTLVDFDESTLAVAEAQIGASRQSSRCLAPVKLVRQSVNDFIDASRAQSKVLDSEKTAHLKPGKYDLVYCMGLFDYFSDRVCRRLLRIFYEIAAPGSKIMVCNFAPANPIRHFMRYLLDWELKHRDKTDMLGLVPEEIPEGSYHVSKSEDRVECYLHICKPDL